jgi:hypothetical protein
MNGMIFASAASAILSEIYARRAETLAEEMPVKGTNSRLMIDCMAMDVEKLLMITEALWIILKEQHGYNDEDLIKRIQDIDLRDGKLDGKRGKETPPACPSCKRTLIGKHPLCLYCGTKVARDPFQR